MCLWERWDLCSQGISFPSKSRVELAWPCGSSLVPSVALALSWARSACVLREPSSPGTLPSATCRGHFHCPPTALGSSFSPLAWAKEMLQLVPEGAKAQRAFFRGREGLQGLTSCSLKVLLQRPVVFSVETCSQLCPSVLVPFPSLAWAGAALLILTSALPRAKPCCSAADDSSCPAECLLVASQAQRAAAVLLPLLWAAHMNLAPCTSCLAVVWSGPSAGRAHGRGRGGCFTGEKKAFWPAQGCWGMELAPGVGTSPAPQGSGLG